MIYYKKKGFKCNLGTEITLKRWNNATNTYDIATVNIILDLK